MTKQFSKAVRKSGLRAIDNGTRYDVAGNLKRLAREIEQGKRGDVRHVVVAVQSLGNNTECFSAFQYGSGTLKDTLYLLERTKGLITK